MDFTPSKKPFVENSLREVYIIRSELEREKLRTTQLSETLRKVIDISNLPKDQFRWYNLLGGNIMRKTRKQKRGGQPVTNWSFTPTSLPGAISSPPPSAPLRRTDASGDYVGFSPMLARRELDSARRLDFGDEPVQHPPGCVPVSKRLPGHPRDQCEKSDSADGLDRAICKQPGDNPVRTLDDCGPTRVGGKRKRKTKKSKRKHRKV